MENENKKGQKKKLTVKNILFLILLGLLIILFKFFLTRPNFCADTCSNINSELDVIKCLDACSINAEDYRDPVSNIKIIIYSSIVIIFFVILFRYIINSERRNTNNFFLQFLLWIKKIKNNLLNDEKQIKNDYKKLE